MPSASITVITHLKSGQLKFLSETATSIIQAAEQVDFPVEWNITYCTDAYASHQLDCVKKITPIEVNVIGIPPGSCPATGINYAIAESENNTMLVHCGAGDMLAQDRLCLLNMDADNAISLCAVDHYVDGELSHSDVLRGGILSYPWWEKSINQEDHQITYNPVSWSMPQKLARRSGGLPGLPVLAEEVLMKKAHDFTKCDLMVFPQVGYLKRIPRDDKGGDHPDRSLIWRTWIDT